MSQSKETKGHDYALARRLGLFDATMIVMGGIIGAGIFTNPLRGRTAGAHAPF